MSSPPRIVVVGSLNIDLNYLVDRIPVAGETVASRGVVRHLGGKGANQATASAKAGGTVSLVGAVGDDSDGELYLDSLEKSGIESLVSLKAAVPTGSAIILSESSGENLIVIEAGANDRLSPGDVDRALASRDEIDIVLLQLECPLETVERAARIGRERGAIVVVNPSPWSDAFLDLGIQFDVLVVNESEALHLGDRAFTMCEHLITTRGSDSTIYRNSSGESFEVPAFQVSAVDTVGAGDTFTGSLAVALGEGKEMTEAIRFANAAGALATRQLGAQSAMPRREDIEELCKC